MNYSFSYLIDHVLFAKLKLSRVMSFISLIRLKITSLLSPPVFSIREFKRSIDITLSKIGTALGTAQYQTFHR